MGGILCFDKSFCSAPQAIFLIQAYGEVSSAAMTVGQEARLGVRLSLRSLGKLEAILTHSLLMNKY